ncbi:pyridoxamine 5'-phosphate oxidase [Antrihabitans cavernicola]|uniref:Pyridoxine/pyridoxamine 5'-phosphate oxidase n=1 Tax=Antrihabitans cavernicola TaxID=2495913 RepID=A0A5A7S7V1_9NOCA|nr:pyridoxamine 5'-phosphate oxidase [Spelaeibacter cavernicola]KAA0021279.1 pyridoxamine 5'-phosphate oxidase [Spelaeibacter cavernicola]
MRVNYGGSSDLDESWLDQGWEPLMRHWLRDAVDGGVAEPNAMVLATVDAAGHPASRVVLCKDIGPDGIVFYSNYGSDKAAQLTANPHASATFGWPLIARQITLRGEVERVSSERTQRYWQSRPRGSQLGAWASQQSRPIGTRADLERALADVTARFGDAGEIPVPPQWGGFLLRPATVEFWQGKENRLHNRVRTTATDSGWRTERLQP